jgi:hypothetical protein
VRFATTLLVAVAALALGACGGDDENTAPVPLGDRFLTAEDAPGSKADPEEKRETTADFDAFIASLPDRMVDPDTEELTALFEEAGFESSGVDTRFYGETHTPGTSPHAVSSFVGLGSDEAATRALDLLETDSKKPCPRSCAAQISTFDVDGIPGARGVRRVQTAEDIERVGLPDQVPSDSYWVAFTLGPVVYTVDLQGPPGSVSEEQALEIATAYHDRLSGGT